jgi:hypothetical protein
MYSTCICNIFSAVVHVGELKKKKLSSVGPPPRLKWFLSVKQ